MKILLANPRGFCAGVKRAVNIVKNSLKIYGAPIYVYHEIVHNQYVIRKFRECGVIFVEKISDVPNGAILIFSAHGVSQAIRDEAKNRNFIIFDATCPLVTKIHMKVARSSQLGEESILIGHAGHPEIEGTMGQYNNPNGGIYLVESVKDVLKLKVKNESCLSIITQTTLSVDSVSDITDALCKRFLKMKRPRKSSICYATTNRQEAVRALALKADVVLVLGSKNSSNSNRLVELVKKMGKVSFLIEDEFSIKKEWIRKAKFVGITAGASVPDILVQNTIHRLRDLGGNEVISLKGKIQENKYFNLPKALRIPKSLCIKVKNI